MIKAVIFDVDGTLIDNVDALAKGWRKFARQLNLKPPTKSQVKGFLGIPYYEISQEMWPGFNPYEHAEEFRRCVAYYINEMKPTIDRKRLMLLKKSFKIAIVTSARRNNVKQYLSDVIDLFDVVIAAEDTEKHKPDPAPLLLCCNKLKIKPSEALYVGDAVYDYLCARGAGASFVGVLTGVMSVGYLKKLDVPYLRSAKDVQKYAVKMNGKNGT